MTLLDLCHDNCLTCLGPLAADCTLCQDSTATPSPLARGTCTLTQTVAHCKVSDATACTKCKENYFVKPPSPNTCETSTMTECLYETDNSAAGVNDCTLGGCIGNVLFDGSAAACIVLNFACDATCLTCHSGNAAT